MLKIRNQSLLCLCSRLIRERAGQDWPLTADILLALPNTEPRRIELEIARPKLCVLRGSEEMRKLFPDASAAKSEAWGLRVQDFI